MFGVVPKVLWQKSFAADHVNRIKLSLNSCLIKTLNALILIETGIGSKLDQKNRDIYGVEINPGLVASLEKIGFKVENIDFVINTHLHFDHCGGNTYEEKGKILPTFPEAKYVIQRKEWESALDPNERDRASYLSENFLPLEEAGLVLFVDGDSEISDGVEVVLVPGHTAAHQCVKIQSQERILFHLGDLVPTAAHIKLPYIMSYDLNPLQTLENKKKIYEQAIREDWVFAFDHDPRYYFGKVKEEGKKYRFKALEQRAELY